MDRYYITWFVLYRDGKDTGRKLGLHYVNQKDYVKKVKSLYEDYPESKGYSLKFLKTEEKNFT